MGKPIDADGTGACPIDMSHESNQARALKVLTTRGLAKTNEGSAMTHIRWSIALLVLSNAISGGALGAPQLPSSKVIASDGRSARDCVTLQTLTSRDSALGGGGRVLANGCSDVVSIGWCYVEGDCRTETGSSWNLDPGKSWPVSVEKEMRWGACHGKDTMRFEEGTFGLRVICRAPDQTAPAVAEAAAPVDDGVIVRRTGTEAMSEVQAGLEQADQWKRDSAIREAAARAEQVRQAEEDRKYAEAEQRRKEKAARKASNARNWSGVMNVLGAVIGTAAQIHVQRQVQRQAQVYVPIQPGAAATGYYNQQGETSKYYPPIQGCAVALAGNTTAYCIRNTCGKTVEVHFSGGRLSNPPGNCHPVSGTPTIYGVCEHNDHFDRARQQCKR